MANENKDHNALNQSKDIQRYDIGNDIRLKRDVVSEKEDTSNIKQQNILECPYDVIFLSSDQQPIYLVPLANPIDANDSNSSENNIESYLQYIQDSKLPLTFPFNSSNAVHLESIDPQQQMELHCNSRRTDDIHCSSNSKNPTESSRILKQSNAENHTNFTHSNIDSGPILSVSGRQTKNSQAPERNAQNRSKCDCLDKKEHYKGCDFYAAKLIFDLRGAPEQLNVSTLIKETLLQLNYSGRVEIKKDCPERSKKLEMEKSDALTQRDLIEAYDSLIKKFELFKSLTH